MVQKDPGRYRRNGYQSKPRHLRCSLGTIAYRFAQLIDQQEKRTLMPLVEALSIPAYDHYLEEAMEPAIGLSVHVSYRRATREVECIQGQSISHTTVHGKPPTGWDGVSALPVAREERLPLNPLCRWLQKAPASTSDREASIHPGHESNQGPIGKAPP